MITADGKLRRPRPKWAIPLTEGPRYLGAHGGRGSGKSHEFATMAIERAVAYPSMKGVCIREVQRSLRFSAKALLEAKIRALGVEHMFDILKTEIRRVDSDGVIIFEGMQDHTADTIKSLEGFDWAWVEEAQALSAHSLKLLRPTILRKPGSQIWASWNPDQPEDAIDALLRGDPPSDAVVVSVNYEKNPYDLGGLREELEYDKRDPDVFDHVWRGGYNTKSEAQIFSGRWREDEFEPQTHWDGPYFGADWGFAKDPTVLVEMYLHGDTVYWYRESGGVGIELDGIGPRWAADVPDAAKNEIRADSARPETISYLKRKGYPRLSAAAKWSGSVEDGVEWLRSKQHIVHSQCTGVKREMRLYSYKVNKAGDVLSQIADKENHYIDAGRYALAPLIKKNGFAPPSSQRPGYH